ncbi:MAG: hypothetical protein UH788_03900 [Treponemataceae bacterium]|nr:hypothetical protein [Treponemataceae bacterium]
MKKLFLFGLLMIMSVCCVFGQIDSKKLFLATNSFVTEESDDWKIYDGKFTVMDTINEEYTFDGGFVVKILVGSSRYDFTCTVKNEGDDFSVSISEMKSYACDKNGKIIKNGSIMKTSSKVAEQYAAQMKDEIKARMNDISDDTVEASYTKIVAHPTTLNLIAETMSELALKKFVEKNVNGKTVEVSVILDIIKENPIKNGDLKDYSYYAFSHIEDNVDFTKYSRINIYSNNDKLLTSKIDSIYKAKGTVEVSFDIIGEMSYQITE